MERKKEERATRAARSFPPACPPPDFTSNSPPFNRNGNLILGLISYVSGSTDREELRETIERCQSRGDRLASGETSVFS